MRIFSKAWEWVAKEPHHLIGVRILQIAIGVMILVHICVSLPFVGYLWGPNGIGQGSTSYLLGPTVGGIVDTVYTTDTYIFCILFVLALGALGLLFGYWTRVATFLIVVTYFLIITRFSEYSDGGEEITPLVIIYMLFLIPHRKKYSSGQLQVWLHNIAVLAIILQLMVMYTASGFFKSIGPLWRNGTAMYYITQVQQFTLPGANALFSIPLIVYVATFVSMFYQLMFPMAIISRFKLLWIAIGILFHLSIAILTGLVTFSTVMIGLKLFLISDQEYSKIYNIGCLLYQRASRAVVHIFQKQARESAPDIEHSMTKTRSDKIEACE